MEKASGRQYLVFRLCVLAWLFGWFIKYSFFGDYFLHTVFAYPISTNQFPQFFQNNYVAAYAYHLPIISLIGLFTQRRSVFILIGLLLLSCTTILGLHSNTYNDMTFISSFWVAIWLVWFAFYINDIEHIISQGPFLVKCIVGLIFLGGTVGKLTPEYWSGEAFYNTVVLQTPGYFGKFIINYFSVEQQKVIMSMLSKVIIIVEGTLVFSPLYPYRFFCVLSVLTMGAIFLLRSWQILSVLSCLAGIILACLLLLNESSEKNLD